MKKHLETWWKSLSHPRDQLSPIPPDEYAERFVKFIRANIKTKDEIVTEKAEEPQQPSSPLTTIEEREDRRILDRAYRQLRKENRSNGEKPEVDVGRSTSVSPDREKPEQVLPVVTMRNSRDNDKPEGSDSTLIEYGLPTGHTKLARRELVKSPEQETSLGTLEKMMQLQARGNLQSQTA